MRADIEKYLSTVLQSTAKTIAEKLGMDRLIVARELNAMVSAGVIERKLEGASARHQEYIYWLTQKDGVEMHPQTLPASTTAVAKPATHPVEKTEVTKVSLAEVEPKLRRQIAALEDQMTAINLKLENEVKAHQLTHNEAVKALNQLTELRASLADAIKRAAEWEEKHDMLQQRIEQYDERQRFDVWFKTRPESKGSSDSTSLKEKMWESWLERSRLVEVAA